MKIRRGLAWVVVLVLTTGSAAAQEVSSTSGPLDNGKMWLFENPPLEYLEQTYGFRPDAAWLERARLSTLRIPRCSASLVSPNGLVATNHHCIRRYLPSIQKEGEHLLDEGFLALDLADERRIPGYYADQLIAVEDVTDEVYRVIETAQTDAERESAVNEGTAAVENRLRALHEGSEGIVVQVVPLYDGGRYSAYVYRRFSDVRFVMAAELQMGFFGGDGDNFTYPRYALDFAMLRLYGEDGKPLSTPDHFTFSEAGVSEGDLVFVIGNPGRTSRQMTVAQLVYLRDVRVRIRSRLLTHRLNAYRDFYAAHREAGEALDMRNTMFGISNSEKAYVGRLAALSEPWVMARRQDDERKFREAIAADPDLRIRFGSLHGQIESVTGEQRMLAAAEGAFTEFATATYGSSLERRLVLAWTWLRERAAGVDAEATRDRLLLIPDLPGPLDRRLWELRLEDWSLYLGPADPIVRLAGSVSDLLDTSVLRSEASTRAAVEDGNLTMDDPAMKLAAELMPRFRDFESATAGLDGRLSVLQSELGRARYAVYGVSVPPDGSSSARFTDGVVRGYEFNGTLAPWHTTFYGLYDRNRSFGSHPDWALPPRWATPPPDLDLSTPLDFISTADTYGGNSGSPAVTRDLELVGMNFDRNIEGLVRDYMYIPERGRNIMVDLRAVKVSMNAVYGADRLVLELTKGRLVPTDGEAETLVH